MLNNLIFVALLFNLRNFASWDFSDHHLIFAKYFGLNEPVQAVKNQPVALVFHYINRV